jgi:hypothetical protein
MTVTVTYTYAVAAGQILQVDVAYGPEFTLAEVDIPGPVAAGQTVTGSVTTPMVETSCSVTGGD